MPKRARREPEPPELPEPSIGDGLLDNIDPMSLLHNPQALLAGTPEELDPALAHDRMLIELRRAFLRPRLSYEDLEPYRVRVGWRWAREMASLKSLANDDELLGDVTVSAASDPWRDPDAGQRPSNRAYYRLRADAVDRVNRPEGVAILPPSIPVTMREHNGVAREDYTPHSDPGLLLWMAAFKRVMSYLGVEHGSTDEPDQGRYGLRGLLDLSTVRVLFPSPVRIMLWEELVVREAWEGIVKGGQREAEQKLVAAYGLTDEEIARVIKMAKAYGSKAFSTDTEVDRAVICARLEELVLRSREGKRDLRVELAALKQLAIVKGVSRGAAEDFIKEAYDSMRKASAEDSPAKREPEEDGGILNRLSEGHPS